MNNDNATAVTVNVGFPTIKVIDPTIDHLLLRSIKALQFISTITGMSLLLIHLSFVMFLVAQTQYHYYVVFVLPWPICLIVCVAKSMAGILTRVLQFIWVGFAFSSIGSLLYLILLPCWLGYINIFAWLALIGGAIICLISLTLVVILQHLTPFEYQQNQNYLYKCHRFFVFEQLINIALFLTSDDLYVCSFVISVQSYLGMIEHPLSYVEQAWKVNMVAMILLLFGFVILFVIAFYYLPSIAFISGITYCLSWTIFLIISLVGVITRSAFEIAIGFVLCTALWVRMFTFAIDLLSNVRLLSDESLVLVIYTLVFSILGMIQCLIMYDYVLVLLAVARVKASRPILAQEMQIVTG